MQNSSLEVCLIGLARGENAIARKSRLARSVRIAKKFAKQQQAKVERTRCVSSKSAADWGATRGVGRYVEPPLVTGELRLKN